MGVDVSFVEVVEASMELVKSFRRSLHGSSGTFLGIKGYSSGKFHRSFHELYCLPLDSTKLHELPPDSMYFR